MHSTYMSGTPNYFLGAVDMVKVVDPPIGCEGLYFHACAKIGYP